MKNRIIQFLLVPIMVIMIYAFNNDVQSDWDIPEKYQTMKNPVAADKASITEGKALYTLHCKSCHGKDGLGDGPKAANLATSSGDFTDEDFQSQSDGVLFYKTSIGKGDMPSFEKKLPDADEIWSIINFIRTME